MQYPSPSPHFGPKSAFVDPNKFGVGKSQIKIIEKIWNLTKAPGAPELSRQDLAALKKELEAVLERLEGNQSHFANQLALLLNYLQDLANGRPSQPIAINRIAYEAQGQSSPNSQKQSPSVGMGSAAPQKQNNLRRQDPRAHKRQNITHADRSRSNAANSNNVWNRVETYFQPLPTEAEFDQIFARQVLPEIEEITEPIEHWSLAFANPTTRANGRAMLPPGPPASPDDISDYWTKTRQWFQIEQCQKNNSSILNRLLNSFVEAEQLPAHENGKVKPLFLRTHGLLPRMQAGYLHYNFDARLGFELDSLDLRRQEKSDGNVAPFQDEVKQDMVEIETKILPELHHYYREFKNCLPRWRIAEQRKKDRLEAANKRIADWQAKKKLKK
jgi:hypothetical protein